MPGSTRGSIVRSIQILLDAGTVAGMTDEQLLNQFLEGNSDAAEAAFTALVKLHGPMVWGVCRAALADLHDVEDAFQATFLVLVRKAGSVRRRDTLGPWLYGVARRVASRAGALRRRRRERSEADVEAMEATTMSNPDRREEIEALHRELDRLPEKYRAAVVLCHLEGRTQAEAARLLGCPIGTVGVRIIRAREILRSRLTRRGLALPAVLAGASLAPSTVSAMVVPATLASSTVKAAIGIAAGKTLAAGGVSATALQLSQGVLKVMTITRFSIAASCVLIAAGLTSTSIGWIARGDRPPKGDPIDQPVAPETRSRVAALRADDRPPTGWGGGGRGFALVQDTDIKHSGNASGLIESTGPALDGFGTFTQGIRAERYRGKRLRLSAYAKSSRASGNAGLWMRVDGKTRSPLAFDNMMNRPIRGTTDWKKYEVVLDIPEEAENLFFGFLMAGGGRAWVDDITLETVGKDVKVTDLKVQPTDQRSNQALQLPNQPVNLDFEK
jgi:RNA polymerase sigma factor (sigma-70 family)